MSKKSNRTAHLLTVGVCAGERYWCLCKDDATPHPCEGREVCHVVIKRVSKQEVTYRFERNAGAGVKQELVTVTLAHWREGGRRLITEDP